MTGSRYLSAPEAAERLGVSRATLYSYVSRGLVRSEPAGGSSRARRYRTEDIERLKRRKEQRGDPGRAVREALNWGEPVLESALTLIADDRLYYRGRDALELARTRTFEEVAALLWTGETSVFEEPAPGLPQRWRAVLAGTGNLPVFERFQALLPLAAAEDLAAYDLRPEAVARTGARILELLAAVAAGRENGRVAERLQERWVPQDEAARRALEAALILCADHELNVSAFTVRCVASAGSPPYAAVSAGLGALQGTRHGGYTERVEALLREVGAPGRAREALAARLRRGEPLPGFGHRLYPAGDPRCRELLRLAWELRPDSPGVELSEAVCAAALELTGERPVLDFGLVTLARALELPAGAPLVLFALGRTAGWIGHAIEQYATGRLIRPRARYTGEQPAG
jgi:citrate synthase